MSLYAAVCETDITPPLGVWMCGYAFRPTGCTAVHDPLYARALVVTDGSERVALLSMDLLGLDFDLVDQVRAGIQEHTGIPGRAVMLHATHTHGGPNVGQLNAMGGRDPAYTDILVRKLIGIARQANAEMRPVSLAYGRAAIQIGANRRQLSDQSHKSAIGVNLAGPVASHVDVMEVQDLRGRPVAVLFSHACHPTTLGGDNLRITADFCGYACDRVRAETGAVPIFLQGCAGNINPYPRGTFEDAKRHGEDLAEAALEALAAPEPLVGSTVRAEEQSIDLPLIPPPPLEVCTGDVAEWESRVEEEKRGGHAGRILNAEGLLAYARFQRARSAEAGASDTSPFTLQLLDLGGARVLGLPAEMFVQYGLDFQHQSPDPLFALGYTNGVHGYVPTAADYPFGGYEVDTAHRYYGTLMYTPDCEPLIRNAAYRLLDCPDPDLSPYSV